MKTELQTQSEILQQKVDAFKHEKVKPGDHWENIRELLKINYQLIKIKYHG